MDDLEKRWQFRMRRRCEPLVEVWWRALDPLENVIMSLSARRLGSRR